MPLIKFISGYAEAVFGKESKHSIGRKLLLYVLLASTLFTLILTVIHLKIDYDSGVSEIEERFRQIESSHQSTLANSLWDVNIPQIYSTIDDISQLPDVRKVVVV